MRVFTFILPLLLLSQLSFGQLGKAADIMAEKRIKKVEKSLEFKTVSFDNLSADCQRTTLEQRKKLSKKKKVQEALQELEEILETQYQRVQNGELMDKEEFARPNQLLLQIKRDAPLVNREKYTAEIRFYRDYIRAKNDIVAKAAEEKKREDRFREYDERQAEKKRKEEEQKRLALEKKEAKRIADSIAWANTPPAERAFITAKSEYNAFEKMQWLNEGPKVTKVFQSLADALEFGTPTEDVKTYLDKLNGISKKVGFRKQISLTDLKYFSSSSQKEAKTQIEKLTAELENAQPSKANVNELRSKYQSIIRYSKFYMVDYNFNSDAKFTAQRKLLMLELNYGDTDAACRVLSKQPDYENYRTSQCKAWDEKRMAARLAENAKKLKEEVAQWRKDHPGMIKMKSLIGMFSTDIEAYLGKPTKLDDDLYSYETTDGKYEIGYHYSKAILIDFTPSREIKFDKSLLSSDGNLFDHEDHPTGICTGDTKVDKFGGLDRISFEWYCDQTTAITFFGEGGKLISVTAF